MEFLTQETKDNMKTQKTILLITLLFIGVVSMAMSGDMEWLEGKWSQKNMERVNGNLEPGKKVGNYIVFEIKNNEQVIRDGLERNIITRHTKVVQSGVGVFVSRSSKARDRIFWVVERDDGFWLNIWVADSVSNQTDMFRMIPLPEGKDIPIKKMILSSGGADGTAEGFVFFRED